MGFGRLKGQWNCCVVNIGVSECVLACVVVGLLNMFGLVMLLFSHVYVSVFCFCACFCACLGVCFVRVFGMVGSTSESAWRTPC